MTQMHQPRRTIRVKTRVRYTRSTHFPGFSRYSIHLCLATVFPPLGWKCSIPLFSANFLLPPLLLLFLSSCWLNALAVECLLFNCRGCAYSSSRNTFSFSINIEGKFVVRIFNGNEIIMIVFIFAD